MSGIIGQVKNNNEFLQIMTNEGWKKVIYWGQTRQNIGILVCNQHFSPTNLNKQSKKHNQAIQYVRCYWKNKKTIMIFYNS